MKKEYTIAFILSLFVLGSVLDSISGSARPELKMPFEFFTLKIISIYPLTAVSVLVKGLFISISTIFLLSFIKQFYLAKSLGTFLFAVLAQLYAIQQVTTHSRTTTFEWTLGLCAASIFLTIPVIIFLLFGLIKNLHKKISQTVDTSSQQTT